MADIEINVNGGSSKRLLTAGKYCPKNIKVTALGGAKKDVNFYDYDGTLVTSYSLAEASTLTTLPTALTHEGLTFQGWNHSLSTIKATEKPIDIGATYNTSDGKTRLYVTIPSSVTEGNPPPIKQVALRINQLTSNGVWINWGDGISPTTAIPASGNVYTTHTYQNAGEYVITLAAEGNCFYSLGWDNGTSSVLGCTNANEKVYTNMLKKVEVGTKVTAINDYAFKECYSLTSVTIPINVTAIGDYAFLDCYSLGTVVIPSSVTTIGDYIFQNCKNLKTVIIPSSVTTIGDYAFHNCYALDNAIIPDSVTELPQIVRTAQKAPYGR